MKLSQCEKILIAMLSNKDKEIWMASDFQSGKYFIGYEASARMSDLIRLYPDLFIIGKIKRYRTLSINWKEKKMIKLLKKQYNIKKK